MHNIVLYQSVLVFLHCSVTSEFFIAVRIKKYTSRYEVNAFRKKVRIVRYDCVCVTYLMKMLIRFTKSNYERKAN